MSERPEGDNSGRRRRRSHRRTRSSGDAAPGSKPAADASDAPRTPPKKEGRSAQERKQQTATALKSPEAIARLRARVEAAAAELARLRQENAALAARVGELETRPAVTSDASVLVFDEDPEALQERIAAFIEAIDQYLATESGGDADAD